MSRVGAVWLVMAAIVAVAPQSAYSQFVPSSQQAAYSRFAPPSPQTGLSRTVPASQQTAVGREGGDGDYTLPFVTPAASLLGVTESDFLLSAPTGDIPQPLVAFPQQDNPRGGLPYMIAGGALFVGGLIAGGTAGTVLMIGGGVVGAYGLILYF